MSNAMFTPTALQLSSDEAIESVLSDIPFLCIGLLGVAVFSFFLAMKQVTLPISYVYTSSFFAFAAAILDISRVLIQSRGSTPDKRSENAVSGFITAGEIFLSLSLGFLYLFLWALVSQCPHGECDRSEDLKTEYDPREHAHSASWSRWGILGMILMWASLAMSLSIPLLQIVWRDVQSQQGYHTLYVAESTIETALSAIFILKILLNIFLSPHSPWWKSLIYYIAPLFALLLSAGLGIGNLLYFAFSETTPGRFLRAVEMYILVLYNLISSFYNIRSASSNVDAHGRAELADNLGATLVKKSLENLDSTIPKSQSISATRPIKTDQTSGEKTWITLDVSSGPSNTEQIWNTESAGYVASVHSDHPIISGSIALSTPRGKTTAEGFTSSPPMSASTATSTYGDISGGLTPKPRPYTDVSLSYYTMGPSSPFPKLLETSSRANSPQHAAGRRKVNALESTPAQSTSRPPSSTNSFDELLRQQTELDMSIAALRLFSPEPDRMSLGSIDQVSQAVEQPLSAPANRRKNSLASLSVDHKPESASGRSEFSLSNFPEPPAAGPSVPPPSISRFTGIGGRSSITFSRKDGALAVPVPTTATPTSSILGIPMANEEARLHSAGTQYDVTSFIDGLAGPVTSTVLPSSTLKNAFKLGTDRNDESTRIDMTATDSMPMLKPMILASIASPRTVGPSVASGMTAQKSTESVEEVDPSPIPIVNAPLRPLYLGTPSAAVPIILPSSMVPIGTRRKPLATSTMRRPVISTPRPQSNDENMDQAPGAFERPRPPPLLFERRER